MNGEESVLPRRCVYLVNLSLGTFGILSANECETAGILFSLATITEDPVSNARFV